MQTFTMSPARAASVLRLPPEHRPAWSAWRRIRRPSSTAVPTSPRSVYGRRHRHVVALSTLPIRPTPTIFPVCSDRWWLTCLASSSTTPSERSPTLWASAAISPRAEYYAVSSPTEDPDLTGSRTSTPNAVPIRGVAVSATSRDALDTVAIGFGASGGLTAQFSAGAIVSANHTLAHIGTNAVVNESTAGAADAADRDGGGRIGSVLRRAGGWRAPSSSPSVVSWLGRRSIQSGVLRMIRPKPASAARTGQRARATCWSRPRRSTTSWSSRPGWRRRSADRTSLADGSVDFISIKQATHAFIGDKRRGQCGRQCAWSRPTAIPTSTAMAGGGRRWARASRGWLVIRHGGHRQRYRSIYRQGHHGQRPGEFPAARCKSSTARSRLRWERRRFTASPCRQRAAKTSST